MTLVTQGLTFFFISLDKNEENVLTLQHAA